VRGTAATCPHEWTLRRVYDFFPRLNERRLNLGAQLFGGEQQMLAIGAH
jgi:branched-chain amino acid transport system ATP-binding protein